MGVAAYNRSSNAIRESIARDTHRHAEFELMERWNAIPKADDAGRPFGPVIIDHDERRGVWWLMDAERKEEGYSYCYKSITELMHRWDVYVTSYDGKYWGAEIVARSRAEIVDRHLSSITSRRR